MSPDLPVLAALGGLGVLAAAAVVAGWLAVRRARTSRQVVQRQLAESRGEVDRLAEQVERLAAEVSGGRQPADVDHEYVITTLAHAHRAASEAGAAEARPRWTREQRGPGGLVEEQAVARLAQVDTSTPLGARAADLALRALALGHGVRRALSQENRDRAFAAAHVARRRSRRARRAELREARRLVRAVRDRQAAPTQDVA